MKAADIMTRRVVSIAPEASIGDAARLMWKYRISGLPVLDGAGKLVGIVTEADFLRRPETGTERRRPRWLRLLTGRVAEATEYVHSHGRRVAEVMTHDPIVIHESTPLDEVVDLMERHRVKRLPVMHGRRIVGIVSRANLLHALASLIGKPTRPHKNDGAIRHHILDQLEKQHWARGTDVNVMAYHGVVELWGEVADEEQLTAVRVLVENTPGVKSIHDHLVVSEALFVM